MNRSAIDAWYENKEDELVDAIARLVKHNSIRGEASDGKPFGAGPAAALEEGLSLAAQWGMKTENYDGYVGLCDLNDKPDQLHILAHMDIVDAGGGWDTDPFTLVREGDIIYGRGVDDDKGPAVAALLAMRCVKELGVELSKNVKLVLGTDEESGSSDIAYYYARNPYAPYSVSPDAEFPVINLEKGHMQPEFEQAWEVSGMLPRVSSLDGGIRTNVVAPEATACVLGLTPEEVAALCGDTGCDYTVSAIEGGAQVVCHGKNAHAATPDEGKNAITGLIDVLNRLPLADCGSTRALKQLNRLFPHGDNCGRALGIEMEDEISGKLTLTFSILHLDESGMHGHFDSRTPICANDDNCRKVVETAFAEAGIQFHYQGKGAHHVDENSPFIKTLLEQYETFSGKRGYCVAIGGGTYVHDIPGGVAFGAGELDWESNLHSANERARISQLILCSKIYAGVILELCR